MEGGKLPVKQIKAFLEASYDVKDTVKNIDGYQLDVNLSNKWGKVFVHPQLRKVVVAHRGTRSKTDWRNNAMISLGAYQLTDRFKTGKLLQEQAEAKYPDYKIYTLGHSQAGQLVNLLGKNTVGVSVNPAYVTPLMGEYQGKNEYVIKSSLDPVSSLKNIQNATLNITNPGYNKKHNIVIPAQTNNPLTEHSLIILDRLDPNMMIGSGHNKYKVNMDALKNYQKK